MRFTTFATAACGIALSVSIVFATGSAIAQDDGPLQGSIVSGSCDDLGDSVATLNDIAPSSGDVQGSESALSVWESDSEVDLTLSDALGDPHAVLISNSGGGVACGDIGGIVDKDGELTIGLQAMENPGYYGIANLDDDDDELDVEIYLVVQSN